MSNPRPARRLAFVIHDLNTWGGMERCTLEVARRLSRRWPVDVHAYRLDDPSLTCGGWGDVRFRRVRFRPRGPELPRFLYFHAVTSWKLLRRRRGRTGALIHAAGACTQVSDVIQVHFVHAAWKAKRATLPDHLRLPVRAASARGLAVPFLRAYNELVLIVSVLTERIAFRPGRTFVAVSHIVARELEEHLGLREQVHVIHHGVDTEVFHPMGEEDRRVVADLRRSWGADDGDMVVLLVGAYDRKGLAPALEALGALEALVRARIRLVAVGGGNPERFMSRARSLGIADQVKLLPHTRQIAPLYRASDVFLLPTLYEPFGLVVLEAMACGLPAIVSHDAGAAELIRHGESGLLLRDPADHQEIARALQDLAADADLRRRMGRQALETASARTWDRVAVEYERLLEPLMETAG